MFVSGSCFFFSQIWPHYLAGFVALLPNAGFRVLIDGLVFEEAVGVVQHLHQSHKQQDVGVLIRLQLLTIVLHWYHAVQGDAQKLAQLSGLQKNVESLKYCINCTFLFPPWKSS